MAEQTSRQATRIAASANGYKMLPADNGMVRATVITAPDTVTWAQNDTCGNRARIPKGARLLGAYVNCAALGAGVTMDVGIRAWTSDGTGAAIDADGIVAALDVSGAVNAYAGNGDLVDVGDTTVSADAEPYFTLAGANPTDNVDVKVTVLYLAP